jgi:methylphosphotriester-DNA--protein-cysteine methyltransferase
VSQPTSATPSSPRPRTLAGYVGLLLVSTGVLWFLLWWNQHGIAVVSSIVSLAVNRVYQLGVISPGALNPYHFARQFKAATGLPPHQYVIRRRVERAKELLQAGTDLSLAEVALHAGFSDQSQFCHHFKRLVGVTPGRFRMSARIA